MAEASLGHLMTPKEFFEMMDRVSKSETTPEQEMSINMGEFTADEAIYINKVKGYDWHYEMSDSGEVYRRGQKYDQELHALERKMLASGISQERINELWNNYCHKDFKRE